MPAQPVSAIISLFPLSTFLWFFPALAAADVPASVVFIIAHFVSSMQLGLDVG